MFKLLVTTTLASFVSLTLIYSLQAKKKRKETCPVQQDIQQMKINELIDLYLFPAKKREIRNVARESMAAPPYPC